MIPQSLRGLQPKDTNPPLCKHIKAFSRDNNHINVSITQVIIYKDLFTNFSYAFMAHEWFNLATDDVLLFRQRSALSYLFDWFVITHFNLGEVNDTFFRNVGNHLQNL